MQIRRKFAAILAAVVIATSLPTFAASINGVNKIITVAEGTELEGTMAPELKIELEDKLAQGQTFYLNLENAKWTTDAAIKLDQENGLKDKFKFSRENDTQLGVTVTKKQGLKASSDAYRIPMFTKVTGGDAAVSIDSNDTVVTAGKYVFATSNNSASIITVEDPKSFATAGNMAEITLEESHIGAFQSSKDQKVRFELEEIGIIFNYDKGVEIKDAFAGQKAYSGTNLDVKVIDASTLEVTIPKNTLKANQRGAFTLKGIELAADKNASYGEVNVTVSGDLNDAKQLLVAKYGDYGTDLKVAKEYTGIAGQELKDLEFTLSETIADSISGNRKTSFTFSEGVTIKDIKVSKTSGLKTGADAPIATVEEKDEKNTNAFAVKSIAADSNKKTSITFQATLNVPASYTGDVNLIVEGRSLEGRKEVEVATVIAPVEVKVTPATVKVGFANQDGGTVVIEETEKGMLSSGKIFLAMDDTYFNYKQAPEVTVTEGNLKIEGKAKNVKGGIEITVTGKSTKVSALEISGGQLTISGMVPEGTYKVKVGGSAISAHSSEALWNTDKKEFNDIDEIVEEDFVHVGREVEAQAPKVTFVIGESTYTVNGVEKAMDTASYLAKEGRTMLPIRYVSDALGIAENEILWDHASKTVTILADRIVQIKLGSKEMTINGTTVSMTAAAEMKNNRTFIPVAEIARALSTNVEWDEETKTATFN